MSTFSKRITIRSLETGRSQEVAALIDTGATYCLFPRSLLEQIGIRPRERRPFALADGSIVELDIGDIEVTFEARAAPTICIFGSERAEPVLGAVALEGLGLAVDPLNQELVPTVGRLMPLI